MDQSTNKRTKIGNMDYNTERGLVVIDESGKLILPIGLFREQMVDDAVYDDTVHQIDLKHTTGFTAMLVRMADQIDEGIIPEDVRYAVYDTRTRKMSLYSQINLAETKKRKEIFESSDIYIYLMRKFEGPVRLGLTWIKYGEDVKTGGRITSARQRLAKYFTGGKSGKEIRAAKRGR